jgi:hypothetical protein
MMVPAEFCPSDFATASSILQRLDCAGFQEVANCAAALCTSGFAILSILPLAARSVCIPSGSGDQEMAQCDVVTDSPHRCLDGSLIKSAFMQWGRLSTHGSEMEDSQFPDTAGQLSGRSTLRLNIPQTWSDWRHTLHAGQPTARAPPSKLRARTPPKGGSQTGDRPRRGCDVDSISIPTE